MPTLCYLTECSSTNDEILHFLPEHSTAITSVYTFHQTQGRGTYGNQWQSSKEENIAFSSALPTTLFQDDDFWAMLWCTLMARDFLSHITDEKVAIKWPNDLILKQKKISGMLIEKKKVQNIHYYIFGIGINVLQKNFDAFPHAGSLFTQTKKKLDLHTLASDFHSFLTEKSKDILSIENLLHQYNSHLFKREKIAVFETNDIRQNGIIQMMDTNGNLIVELEHDGLKSFYHKEIKMLY